MSNLHFSISPMEDFIHFANEIMGKDGPINLNTNILAHYDYIGAPHKLDKIVIGTSGKKIDFSDITAGFDKIFKSRLFANAMNDDRSYFFEGFTQDGNDYEMQWGS